MLSWLKKESERAKRADAIEPIYHWSEDEIPRYPPFMKGLPVVPPEKLLKTQAELLDRISDTAITTPSEFERLYVPAIERFASFAHLLPASQSHHHRGAGGLLRHSLEVALWAIQSADKVLLETAQTPSQRRKTEPRWQFAVFAAALCHDAGKPVTDIVVTNRERTAVWRAIKENLYDWAKKNKVDAYFLEWREGRHRQHAALSNLIADRIIGIEALEWIEEGGTELIVWLMESLNYNPGPTNPIHDLVIKADQTSVERDLKSLGVAMAGYDLGVPVERHLTDIMRRLVKEGTWLVNQPGARLWNIGGHLYLIWPAAGEEIAKQVREDAIPGIPRTPDGILDMLVERRIAYLRDGAAPGDRFWKIAPACLAEKIPSIRLTAIRLRDDAIVSSTPIPPVEGRLVEDDKDGIEATAAAEQTAPAGDAASSETPRATYQEKAIQAEAEDTSTTGECDTTPKETEMQEQPSPSDPPAIVYQVERINKKPKIALDGAIGEALKALIQDIKSGDKRMKEDADIDAAGYVVLRWPDAFRGYGLTPKNILDELHKREWLWIDPMAPLKKVHEWKMGDIQTKVIRLESDISLMIRDMLGDITTEDDEREVYAPQPSHRDMTPTSVEAKRPAEEPKPDVPAMSRKPEERGDPQPAVAKEASIEQRQVATGADGTASQSSRPTMERQQPTLEDMLRVIANLPGTTEVDGWRTIPKREAVTACKKSGVMLTYVRLIDLAQQHADRLVLDGAFVKYRV